MASCSNLPKWPGAEKAYSAAYKALEKMARAGQVSRTKTGRKTVCSPSEDMRDLIDALNRGNEEQIKGLLFKARDNGYL